MEPSAYDDIILYILDTVDDIYDIHGTSWGYGDDYIHRAMPRDVDGHLLRML